MLLSLRACLASNRGSIKRYLSSGIVSSQRLPVLTLYTKNPCPLCDVAKEKISLLQDRFQFETVDITAKGNREWWDKYKFDIPVFHFEGQFLMQHQADIKLLQSAIEKFESDQEKGKTSQC